MNRLAVVAALVACLTLPAAAEAPKAVDLDFLAGEWTLEDEGGNVVGTSRIHVEAAGVMIHEVREANGGKPQQLWFQNSEPHGGWTQLFIGADGLMREFPPKSMPGEWPLVLGGDGVAARFRMTMWKASNDESRRILERSNDGGKTWSTVFDYVYRRKG
jgi:hypothetical protein